MARQHNESTIVMEDKEISEQVERILASEELRTSEVLRRLLRFLAEKSASGEADDLKEYIVAVDGMGKSSSYDPRHDSSVRIQVGRLRQKLSDYYRTEGINDPIIIDVPKGRFKLCYEHRQPASAESKISEVILPPLNGGKSNEDPASSPAARPKMLWLWVSAVLIALLFAGTFVWRDVASTAGVAGFSPELQELWAPFLTSKRPLILAVEDPLFVEFHTGLGVYIRDKNTNEWKDVPGSTGISAVHQALKGVDMQPSRYYTSFGQVNTTFSIARLLGPQVQNFNISKASFLSSQQIADNNVLFVGIPPRLFESEMQVLPMAVQFVPIEEGIRNLHPLPGEPELFANEYMTAPDEEGVTYALITHLPGPSGNNDIESFTSSRSAGYVAAVSAFTDPTSAQQIVEKLKEQSHGHVPRYFQVLLKVHFKQEVPMQTECILTRELR